MSPLDQQQNLVESSLDAVYQAHAEAIDAGTAQPVVFVIDCEDEIGSQIACAWVGEEAVEDAIANRDPEAETTVFTTAFGWEECRREIGKMFDYLAPVFEGPMPQDGILVVGVTCGGASVLTAPLDPDGQ